jgi:hypothetical protein
MTKNVEYAGKRIDNKEWVYGYYVKIEDKSFIAPPNAKLHYPRELNFNSCIVVLEEVHPDSVSRWIGELDTIGVKIYEDSIVTDFEGNRGVVIFTKAAFWCREIVTKRVGSHGPIFHDWDELQVIGNMTDNPELAEDI